MRIASQVGKDMLGVLEGLFGIDSPLGVAYVCEETLPGGRLCECPTPTREGQVALRIDLCQACKEESPGSRERLRTDVEILASVSSFYLSTNRYKLSEWY
jgi:hypothetical protein